MMHIPMLDLRSEYQHMKEEIDLAIRKCLEHQKWILGPDVKELEERVSSYLGVKRCIGVSSGTDALVLALRAMAIKRKGEEYFSREDEIITTPFTFTATGDAILRAGATPVFIDIDPDTYNIDCLKIEEYLAHNGAHAAGIVPVHLYGQACDMNKIMEMSKANNLFVIEDAAQAFGGMWEGRKLGTIGTAGAFSFFPSKNLGSFGDAGMIATNDEELAEIAGMLLRHGGKDKYNVEHIGYNARLDTLQAAILLVKLKHVDMFNQKRNEVAGSYREALKEIESIVLPWVAPYVYHVYHQYTIRLPVGKRDLLQKYFKDRDLDSMIYYPVPLHQMKVFADRCRLSSDLFNAEKAAKEVLSLPIGPFQSSETTALVIQSVRSFYEET